MQRRRVQSAENTKRIFFLKSNNQSQQQQINHDQGIISIISQNAQQDNLNAQTNSKVINDQSEFENSMRGAYNVTNYFARPKAKIQSQNNSLDFIRNQQANINSPKSSQQKKCKIIMKHNTNVFPQDFFSSTLGVNKSTMGTNDLSYQLNAIKQEGKFIDKYENQKKISHNTEKLNHSIGSVNIRTLKKQEFDSKDIFQQTGSTNLSDSNMMGVVGKQYPAKVKKSSITETKKINSESTCLSSVSTNLSSEKQLQKSEVISSSQKQLRQNIRTSTPKFNVFEGIHAKTNTMSCSEISNKVKQLNLNELIKYNTNAVSNSIDINPNDQSIQNEFLQPIETNRSIQSEYQNSKTQQCLLNPNKLKPPKPVQQYKSGNNKQQLTQQYNTTQQENNSQQKEILTFKRENNRSYSFQIDSSKQTACFQDLISKNESNPSIDDGNLQFSDNNFQIQNRNKRNSLQQNNITDQNNGYIIGVSDSVQIKQRNSLQKFISQEDKIPVVFRQMLIPKKARPNSHNNQQIQLKDKCNIITQIKEKLGSSTSITLKEFDQMFEESSHINDNNRSLNQSRKLNLKEIPPQQQQNKNIKFVVLKQNNNLKKFENTINIVNQDPLKDKIYNSNNFNHQSKTLIKRRSYSLQKQEQNSQNTQSNINRDQIQQMPKSQESIHSNKSNEQKRDLFEFSFSKLTDQNNYNDKEPSQSSIKIEQFKDDTIINEKNALMDNTFNPNQFNNKGWIDKQVNYKENDNKNQQSSNNKENIYQGRERSITLNSQLNKKHMQTSKRMIFDAKPEICFNSQLMNIQINNSNNLLNSQFFQNNVNK